MAVTRDAARHSHTGAGRTASSARSAAGLRIAFSRVAISNQSLTAGMIFESSKVPLTTWFRAMYLVTQTGSWACCRPQPTRYLQIPQTV
jgi:hypothetical protein